jgi:formylglycine-generating enzyme required for sulfatase activity
MKCPRCQHEAAAGTPVCPRCGSALPEEAPLSIGQQPTMGRPGDLPSVGGLPTAGREPAPPSIGDLPTLRAVRRWKAGDKLLGRYRVLGELGQGGMGIVYRCLDEVGSIEIALKALPPELSHNSGEMEEVRENFRLVERLHHPHVAAVKTLEQDAGSGNFYLILELAEGVDLRRWRKQRGGQVPLAEALPVLRQVAQALDFAHSRKIIHRDIKPGNIMVSADGTVKVLDFGLAAQIQSSLSRVSQVHFSTSGTGSYMAPEQWRGQRQDGAADQYALAVVAYELLAGHLPFEVQEAAILREAVLQDTAAPVEGLAGGAAAALSRGLTKGAADRFGSCAEFVEALGKSEIRNPKSEGNTKGKLRWGLAGVGLLLLLLAGGWYLGKVLPEDRGFQNLVLATKEAPWTNSLGMPFVLVPGTEVLFGVCDVRVKDFAVFAGDSAGNGGWDYRKGTEPCMTKSDGRKQRGWDYGWSNPGFAQTGEHPVVCVSWEDAQAFCVWLTKRERAAGKLSASLSYRLPAYWEWSVAVGLNGEEDAKVLGVYLWGTAWPPPSGAGNYAGSEAKDADWPSTSATIDGYQDGYARTSPVGSFQPNRYGLCDLDGNVSQWCEDSADGERKYRVVLGGSWGDRAQDLRLFSNLTPDIRDDTIGFRCVVAGSSR